MYSKRMSRVQWGSDENELCAIKLRIAVLCEIIQRMHARKYDPMFEDL